MRFYDSTPACSAPIVGLDGAVYQRCANCHRVFPVPDFLTKTRRPRRQCRRCIESKSHWNLAHSDRTLTENRRANFGITPEQLAELERKQAGRCAICGVEQFGRGLKRKHHVDHDHTTGRIRGLLCGRCNQVVGLIAATGLDYSEWAHRTVSYLTSAT